MTGSGDLFESFTSGDLKYQPKNMMVVEKGKKLKSKNEEFMLDWVAKKVSCLRMMIFPVLGRSLYMTGLGHKPLKLNSTYLLFIYFL